MKSHTSMTLQAKEEGFGIWSFVTVICTMVKKTKQNKTKTDFKSRNRLWTNSWNTQKGESPSNFPSSAYDYLPYLLASFLYQAQQMRYCEMESQIRMLPAVYAVLAQMTSTLNLLCPALDTQCLWTVALGSHFPRGLSDLASFSAMFIVFSSTLSTLRTYLLSPLHYFRLHYQPPIWKPINCGRRNFILLLPDC